MKTVTRHKGNLRKLQDLTAYLMAVWFCCAFMLPAFALPTEEESAEVMTVTLTCSENFTESEYVDAVSVALVPGADLEDLLNTCKEQGIIRDFAFEDELLHSISFNNGVVLTEGAFGAQSCYDISDGLRRRLPFADFSLTEDTHYTIGFRLSPNDSENQALQNIETVQSSSLWNDSLDAMLDSACSWLYWNAARGNYDAVTALGVANRSANPTDVLLLTELEGVVLDDLSSLTQALTALAYCGYSSPILENRVLFADFINLTEPENCSTQQLCDILLYCDSFAFEIDPNAKLSQNRIIAELLKRQNKDGSFSQSSTGSFGIRTTAKAVTVLQQYRDLAIINEAVQMGISYLSSPSVRNLLFESREYTDTVTVAQMIIAICSCNLPMDDIYFTYDGMTYPDLLQSCFCVSGGFSMRKGETEDALATAAAIEALCALREQGNPYTREDVSLVSFNFTDSKMSKPTVPEEELSPQEPVRRLSSGFWLATFFTAALITVEIIRYTAYHKRLKNLE